MYVKRVGKNWVIESDYGILITDGRGFVMRSSISPIPGFLVNGEDVIRLKKIPDVFIEKHGIKHVIAWFNGKTPVYIVWDKVFDGATGSISTSDFVTYTDFKGRKISVDEVKRIIIQKKLEKSQYEWNNKVLGIKRVGNTTYAVILERGKTRVIITKEDGKYKDVERLTIPLGRDEFKELSVYNDTIVLKYGETYVTYHVGGDAVYVNGIPIEKNELSKYFNEKWVMRIEDVIEKVNIENVRVKNNDIINMIKKLRKHAPVFGPLVAMPTRSQIWTRRGRLVIRKIPKKIPDEYLPLVEWVLYMNDEYNEIFREHEPVIYISGDNIEIRLRSKRSKVIKIGKFYYWLDKTLKSDEKYVGNGGFILALNNGDTYYDPSKNLLVITSKTIFTRRALEKLKRRKEVTVSDIIPGLPKNVKVENGKIYFENRVLKDNVVKVSSEGIWYRIVFVDGIYDVLVPFGCTGSVWKARSSREIPYKKESVLSIDFLNDLNVTWYGIDDYWGERFRFDVDGMEFITISRKSYGLGDMTVHIGNKVYKKDLEAAKIILESAKTYNEFLTLVLMT